MISIGNDIVEVGKLEKIYFNYAEKFLNRIFHRDEINYCFIKRNPMIHLSGRFAAKEAIKKALYPILGPKLTFKEIVIKNKSCGRPFVTISSNLLKIDSIDISISHTDKYATAVAISCFTK